jgi:hypothetical protein
MSTEAAEEALDGDGIDTNLDVDTNLGTSVDTKSGAGLSRAEGVGSLKL